VTGHNQTAHFHLRMVLSADSNCHVGKPLRLQSKSTCWDCSPFPLLLPATWEPRIGTIRRQHLFLSTAEKSLPPFNQYPHYTLLFSSSLLTPKKIKKKKKKPQYIHVNNLSRTIVGVYIMSWCFIFTRRK
jgi:hypothetical protein